MLLSGRTLALIIAFTTRRIILRHFFPRSTGRPANRNRRPRRG